MMNNKSFNNIDEIFDFYRDLKIYGLGVEKSNSDNLIFLKSEPLKYPRTHILVERKLNNEFISLICWNEHKQKYDGLLVKNLEILFNAINDYLYNNSKEFKIYMNLHKL